MSTSVPAIPLVGRVKQSGAAEACWAHNPEVDGSKPSSAKNCFIITTSCQDHHAGRFYSAVSGEKSTTFLCDIEMKMKGHKTVQCEVVWPSGLRRWI